MILAILIAFIILCACLGMYQINFKAGLTKKMEDEKAKIYFSSSSKIFCDHNQEGEQVQLIFDPDQHKMFYVKVTKELSQIVNKPFEDIIACEVIIDGEIVTKTSRGSQLMGAAVGGVLFGGVGAVVGALTGQKKNSEDIKQIIVKIVLNDLKIPNIKINLGKSIAQAKDIEDYIKIILHQKNTLYEGKGEIPSSDADQKNSDSPQIVDIGSRPTISQDPLYAPACDFVKKEKRASISLIQRKFEIDFNRAAQIVEQMEIDRIIGPADESQL